MKIYITDSKMTANLSIIDPKTGVDYITDFVGDSGDFVYDEDREAYCCDLATFVWWDRVTDDHQALNNRVHALSQKYEEGVVTQALEQAQAVGLEDQPAAFNAALDDHLTTYRVTGHGINDTVTVGVRSAQEAFRRYFADRDWFGPNSAKSCDAETGGALGATFMDFDGNRVDVDLEDSREHQ